MSSFINGVINGAILTIAVVAIFAVVLVVIGTVILGVFLLIDHYFPSFFNP